MHSHLGRAAPEQCCSSICDVLAIDRLGRLGLLAHMIPAHWVTRQPETEVAMVLSAASLSSFGMTAANEMICILTIICYRVCHGLRRGRYGTACFRQQGVHGQALVTDTANFPKLCNGAHREGSSHTLMNRVLAFGSAQLLVAPRHFANFALTEALLCSFLIKILEWDFRTPHPKPRYMWMKLRVEITVGMLISCKGRLPSQRGSDES